MKLNLKKPLAFFDLETTGTDVAKDRIVEIAIVKIMPDGSVRTWPAQSGPENRFLINPQMPIPIESSMVHGIYDQDVVAAPTFEQTSSKLFQFLMDCDLGGFNSNKFDIPLLAEEFLRVGVDFSLEGRNLIDVQILFHMMEPRTLKAAYKFYCDKSLEGAHEALPDAMATKEVFEAMLVRYAGVQIEDKAGNLYEPVVNDMDKIHSFTERKKKADLAGHIIYSDQGDIIFNFGKYKGSKVMDVLIKDPGYYSWMQNADFPLYTKKVLTDIRNGDLK
ncbi:MAG: exonuclease domain-containing protein [Flavobacteriales bacterium]|jgi:DNA polymerase-3 subunit epsilon